MSTARRHWLAQLPNLISAARASLAIPICPLVLSGSAQATWLALGLFFLAAATDLVDGAIARAIRAQSALGSHLDALADKVLVGLPLVFIPHAAASQGATAFAALAVFCAAELPRAWMRVQRMRRGRAHHALRSAKWKTLAEYSGVALMIAGLMPSQEPLQFAGAGLVIVAGIYAATLTSRRVFLKRRPRRS